MPPRTFVHAADLHLDSPLRGLEAYEGAPVARVREATRQALRNLVDLCLAERAAFLVLAGDIFDGDWKDFNTGLFFRREVLRLAEAGIHVYLARGNHDAASEVTRELRLPETVHVFSARAAESFVREDLGVALHGRSFPSRAVLEDLAAGYPPPVAGLLNVGVLHTSLTGVPEHEPYAPCRVDELTARGYDYWALGHVHRHAVLHREPRWVVFPGNTQGRHARETGPKGCVVVEVEDTEVTAVRPVALDVVRWETLDVALDPDDDVDALLGRARARLADLAQAAEGRLLAVRLSVRGACRAHDRIVAARDEVVAELRGLELGQDLWLEEVRLRTAPLLRLDELAAGEGFVGELLRELRALRAGGDAASAGDGRRGSAPPGPEAAAAGDRRDGDGARLLALAEEAAGPLRDKLADELREAGIDLADPAAIAALLPEVEALLASRLVGATR